MFYEKNFLSNEKILEIQDTIFNPTFPWYYNNASVPEGYEGEKYQTIKNGYDDIQLVHEIYRFRKPYSNFYEMAMSVFENFCEKNKIEVHALLRGKINLTFSSGKNIVAPAHVDYTHEHKVFIYYVNDSDGDTLIYDQRFNGEDPGKLKIIKKISPIAGSAIVFNGLHYHSPSLPVIKRSRAVINICFL